jgi:hypothetical protein
MTEPKRNQIIRAIYYILMTVLIIFETVLAHRVYIYIITGVFFVLFITALIKQAADERKGRR